MKPLPIAAQLSFDWPAWSLDPKLADQHARQASSDHRRQLWRKGRYAEVAPPLCWLCPWVHAPAWIADFTLCPLHHQHDGAYSSPARCTVTAHIYWRGVHTCPWCGGPAYLGQRWPGEWIANSGTIHVLPACFGPKRYVCLRCWEESPVLRYVQEHAHTLCPLCPMYPDCALALE